MNDCLLLEPLGILAPVFDVAPLERRAVKAVRVADAHAAFDDPDFLAFFLIQKSGANLIDYASPEQLRGDELSIASDIYSLGVLFYQILTGSNPHRAGGKKSAENPQAVLVYDLPRPSATKKTSSKMLFSRVNLGAGIWIISS